MARRNITRMMAMMGHQNDPQRDDLQRREQMLDDRERRLDKREERLDRERQGGARYRDGGWEIRPLDLYDGGVPRYPGMYERGGADMRYSPDFDRPRIYQDDYRRNEMGFVGPEYGGYTAAGRDMIRGGAKGNAIRMPASKLTMEQAQKWTNDMENADGSRGAHWSMDQTNQVMQQRGLNCDKTDFWVMMNAMYSDYCKVAKAHNVDNANFYADLACAFLKDKDAVDNKAAAYYSYILKE